jgi:hypothetical protein
VLATEQKRHCHAKTDHDHRAANESTAEPASEAGPAIAARDSADHHDQRVSPFDYFPLVIFHIFHLSFSIICHWSFAIVLGDFFQMENDKWKMTNGKWKIENGK